MESLKKIFLFMIVCLFLINFSSAGLFDPDSELAFHEEGKNGKYGYYEINDTDFWFFNNKPVKTIELLENEYSIFTAWNIKEIEVFKPIKLFDKTNYLDKEQKNDKSNLLSSELHLFREWKTKTKTKNNYSCISYEISTNQTQVCSEWEDNSYEEEYEGWSDWKTYNFQTVQEGLYQTKTIVTRDSQGTGTIDWVDENEGWDLDEWATWWDSDWTKKRPINLTSNVGNFSYLGVINYSADMNANFSDVRFIDSATESIELNFTIESKTDSDKMRVRIFSKGEDSVYMYYSNPIATTSTESSFNTHLQPISFWYLDEISGNVIDSIGLNNGSRVGASRGVEGIINNSYDFEDSGDDYIFIPNSASLETTADEITVSAWIKRETVGVGVVASMWEVTSSPSQQPWIFLFVNNVIRIDISNHAVQVNSITTITDPSWHHVAFTYDKNAGSNQVKLYIDGNFDNQGTLTSSIDYSASIPLGIGAERVGGTPQSFFDGKIDEVNIFNRSLTATEIKQIYTYTEPIYTVGEELSGIGVSTTLIHPENNQNILNNTVTFNFTSIPTDTNLTNATLYIWWNNGTLENTNFTTLSGNEPVNTTFINTLEDGMYIWNAETCGENAICSFDNSNNSFIVHVTPIIIDISEPNGTIEYITLGDNQTLTWQLAEPGENLSEHVTNCSYTYNSVIAYLSLNNCVVTNTTEFEYVYGVNTLTFNTTDIFNLTSDKTTIWDYIIIEINQTFEENITEGELDDFSLLLNISESSSLTDATFSYNGTNYTTTIVFSNGLYLISSLIVSPTVDENTNFSFNFLFTVDGTNYSTTINEQLVVNSLFDICGGLSNDTLLNMSIVDEETGISINGDIEIVTDITSKSSGATIGTINNTFEDVQYAAICFTPPSAYPSYNLNAEIKYSSDGYVSELYYIQNSDMEDYPRNLTLFDLNQTDSTEFVVTFQNDAFILVEGAVIQLQRKYIGENVYKVVEAPRTSDGGKAIVHIDLNTNIYRVSVVKDGELLKFFDEVVFSCENELAGECEEQLRGDVDPNNDISIETITDFSYSVSISDDNNTVTTLFAVPSGTPSSINVLLEQVDMFGNVTSCNTTVITSAGSITCDFSDTIEKSILQLTISKDSTQLAITNYGVDPKLDMDGMNFFIVFLFLISLVGMAIASPEWMMIIGIMVFMISGTLLLLTGMSLAMGLGAMAWLVVAVIIIILKMAKQEDR